MIATSPISKLGVVALSIGAHALAGYLWLPDMSVDMRGGAEAVLEVRLGNSFADLSAGTMSPESASPPDVTRQEAQEAAERDRPAPVTSAQATPQRADTSPARTLSGEVLEPAGAERPTPAPAASASDPVRADILAAPGAGPAASHTPEAETATARRADATAAAEASQSASALRVEQATGPAAQLTGTEITPIETSPRPQARPDRRITRAEPVRTLPPPKTARGNAAQDARAGSASGTTQHSAPQARAVATSAARNGNAAASNYPGLVNRRISRVRTPRVGEPGTAIVQFTVDAQGRLNALSIVQSSGSARLDEAALSVIRRAAPFPKPPPGAQRVFRKTIQSRG